MIGSFFDTPKYLAPLDPNDKAEDNFEVLMSKEELQMIAKKICDGLHHSVTIIDANRIDEMEKISIDDLRTDSNAEYLSMRSSCRLFHYCAGSVMCHKCDNYHAKKFIQYINGNHDLDYIDRPEFFYDEYENNLPEIIEIDEDGKTRYVFEYHCPILGYRELIFPIYYEEKIFGVLFFLPAVIEDEKDVYFIRRAKKSFFGKKINDPEKIFSAYLEVNKDSSAKSIKKAIINIDKMYMPIEELFKKKGVDGNIITEERTMTFDNYNDFKSFIKDVCSYLKTIEKEISEKYSERRKAFFIDESKKIVDEYFIKITEANSERINDKNQKSLLELQNAWKELTVATESLKNSFGIKNVYIFGDGPSVNMIGNKKKSLYPYNNENWYFDFSTFDLTERRINEFALSFDYPEIKDGLKADLKSDYFIVLFSEIAIICCVDDLDKYFQIYYDMAYKIGSQFIRIHSSIALYAADFMQKKLTLTLRMNRHETAHISTRLKDDIDCYFSEKGKTFTELNPEKQAHVVEDIRNTTKLLSNMANNIGVITGSINKDNIKNKFGTLDINDMLNKWRVMFNDRLKQRNLSLVVGEPEYGLRGQSHIRTVPDLFELMIYNLVDNAVKYSYRGTNIYMYWERCKEGNKFTIVDFGTEAKKDDNIYRLYFRGQADNAKKVDGDGIGLYSVRRICKLLGCEIDFDSDRVSDYNLPLIEWYEKEFKTSIKREERVKKYSQYLRDFDDELKNNIINTYHETKISDDDYDVTAEYIEKRINNPIYKTVFTVKVFDK